MGVNCYISAHQRGIELIDSFLGPKSKFLHLMTDHEMLGLREIRTLLTASKHEKEFTTVEIEDAQSQYVDGEIVDYVNQEFGGRRQMNFKRISRSIRYGLRCANTLGIIRRKSMERVSDEDLYLPPEFLRLEQREKEQVRDMLDCENLKLWSYDTPKTAVATKGNPILFIGWAILGAPYAQKAMAKHLGVEPPDWVHSLKQPDCFEFLQTFFISPFVLCNFLRAVEFEYNKEIPYHNNVHGADVLQTTYSLLKMGGEKYSHGGLDTFSLLVAAACHDIGHPGLTNLYHINTKSDLAVMYNDQSILENMHASRTFRLLNNARTEMDLDITSGLNPNQYQAFRTNVVESILYTDMSKHFRQMGTIQSLVTNLGTDEPSKFSDTNKSISEALLFFLHSADISNSAKPAPLNRQWADKVLEEFFAQGDLEKKKGIPVSPLCDRELVDLCKSQIGFVKFVVLPNFLLLAELIPAVGEEVVPTLRENLAYWEERKEKEDKE